MDRHQKVEKPKAETPIDENEIRITSQGRKRRQVVEVPITKPESGIIMPDTLPREKSTIFQSVSNQYKDRLFGFETSPANLTEKKYISVIGRDVSNAAKTEVIDEFTNNSPTFLLISHGMQEPEMGVNSGRIRKIKVNDVKGQSSAGNKYQDVMDALSQPVSSYTLLYEPHLVPTSKTHGRKKVDMQKGNTNARKFQTPKFQATKKVAAYRFPTNVKSLTVTGMFDGAAVRYLSALKEKELHGIIEGSGYLCGCQSCNYSKTLNAYEFERHAGCKTSHPNDHIRFENGKSMHRVVQELKNTHESTLFDAIQTVTGSPINQKAFYAWKDSFEAVARRISGMEKLRP